MTLQQVCISPNQCVFDVCGFHQNLGALPLTVSPTPRLTKLTGTFGLDGEDCFPLVYIGLCEEEDTVARNVSLDQAINPESYLAVAIRMIRPSEIASTVFCAYRCTPASVIGVPPP